MRFPSVAPNPRRLCIIVVVCQSLSFAVPAFGERWTAMPTASPNILFSVNQTSVVRKDDVVKLRERLVFVIPEQRDEPSGKMGKEKRITGS